MTTPNEPANRGDEPRRGPARAALDFDMAAREIVGPRHEEIYRLEGTSSEFNDLLGRIATALAAQRATGAAAERERCAQIAEADALLWNTRARTAEREDAQFAQHCGSRADEAEYLATALRAQPVAPPEART